MEFPIRTNSQLWHSSNCGYAFILHTCTRVYMGSCMHTCHGGEHRGKFDVSKFPRNLESCDRSSRLSFLTFEHGVSAMVVCDCAAVLDTAAKRVAQRSLQGVAEYRGGQSCLRPTGHSVFLEYSHPVSRWCCCTVDVQEYRVRGYSNSGVGFCVGAGGAGKRSICLYGLSFASQKRKAVWTQRMCDKQQRQRRQNHSGA